MITINILETALYADDIDAAEAFYRDVLGLEVHSRVADRHVFFRCEGQMLLIFAAEQTIQGPSPGALPVPPHGARGPGHICFRVSSEELRRWRTRLLASGVTIEADFEWPGGGRSVYFRDPAGNSLEFAEPKIWGLG
jgi:catechol 2,3-dioxygenase-like lactoylglutathione lyase family enzyme